MTTLRFQLLEEKKIFHLPFHLPYLPSLIRHGKNRFLDEWSENKYSFEFWNNWLIYLSFLNFSTEEEIYTFTIYFWKIWNTRTKINEKLTEEEKIFLLSLSKTDLSHANLSLFVDSETILPNDKYCIFNTVNEFLYLVCCCYFLGISCILIPVHHLNTHISSLSLTEDPIFQEWAKRNFYFSSFSSLSDSLLSLGFPPTSSSPFPWWFIDAWIDQDPLPIENVKKWLENSGLPQRFFQKPLYIHQENKEFSQKNHKSMLVKYSHCKELELQIQE